MLLAKGPSASRLLNKELLAAVPFLLGYDVYPGYLFVPTRMHPPDGASRGDPRAPRPSASLPPWFFDVDQQNFDLFDDMASLPAQPRAISEWARFVVRISWAGNIHLAPKARPFDSTLGYPGEGPRHPQLHPRPAIDLRTFRNLTPAVVARRAGIRSQIALFIFAYGFASLDSFLIASADIIDQVLSDFGQSLFRSGRSLGYFTEGIFRLSTAAGPCEEDCQKHGKLRTFGNLFFLPVTERHFQSLPSLLSSRFA